MSSLQNVTVAGLVADLGLTGHSGISVGPDGDDATMLDVTITPPAWVLLGGGTLFSTDLATTTVQAPTTDGFYHLYVDALEQVTATAPSWTIAATAPSASALAVADVTVSGGVISAATVLDEGLRSLPVQASALPSPAGVPVLRGPYLVDHTDLAHDGDTKTLWTPAAGDVLLRLWAHPATYTSWNTGNVRVGPVSAPTLMDTASNPNAAFPVSSDPPYFLAGDDPVRASLTLGLFPDSVPNGTLAFAAAPEGWGQALSLDGGTSSDGSLGLDGALSTSLDGVSYTDFTFELRVRTAVAAQQVALILVTGFWIGTDADGHAYAKLSGDLADITTTVSLADDAWHSLGLVVVGGTAATLYVDGAVAGTSSGTDGWQQSYQSDLLGATTNGSVPTWTGLLDELAVSHVAQYSGAYSPATAPFSTDRAGLYALYHLDGDGLQALPTPPPTAGHLELYALIARPVAP